MKSYELRSEYDCLVKNSNTESFLDSNSSLSFDEPEKLLIYPINSNKYSYPFSLLLDEEEKNPFFKSFVYKNKKYIYLTTLPTIKNEIIEELNIDNKIYKISISEDYLCFSTNGSKKTIKLLNKFDSYLLHHENKYIILHLIGKVEDMWLYNFEKNQLHHLSGKKIEKIENQILISKEVHDIANHELYETYEIGESDLIKRSSKIKYFENSPQIMRNERVIPIAFLEAIQIEDFELAREYLSPELKENSSIEHFKKYFGNILNIIPLEDFVFAVITPEKTNILKFNIKDSYISDISLE